MSHPVEAPILGLPRDDLMRTAFAFRTLAGVIRARRESRGRSAWSDAENAARKSAVADRNGLRRFTPADVAEWNAAEKDGRIGAERHPESGMTVRVAEMSGGRFGVQAGWDDHHTETVVGSRDLADLLADWLRANSTPAAVDDLRGATEDLHRTRPAAREKSQREKQLGEARAWAEQSDPDWYRWWSLAYMNADTIDGRRLDENEIIGKWKEATGQSTRKPREDASRRAQLASARAWAAGAEPHWYETWNAAYSSPTTPKDLRAREDELLAKFWDARGGRPESDDPAPEPTPLADQLRGKVPDRVLDDPRWKVAEDQYATLTGQGVDAQLLVDTVASIDFDSGKVRAPSGFAAWAMRDAAKKGRAADSKANTEEDARRDVAAEWLAAADAANPLDRARAAQLVGEIDDEFDAALAAKYPGILDGDADRNAASARAAQHDGKARTEEDLARADRDEATVLPDDQVLVVDADGEVIIPFVEAPEPAPEEAAEHDTEAAQQRAAGDAEEGKRLRPEQAANQPMTPPKQAKTNTRTRRRTPTPAAAGTRNNQQTRKRTH